MTNLYTEKFQEKKPMSLKNRAIRIGSSHDVNSPTENSGHNPKSLGSF